MGTRTTRLTRVAVERATLGDDKSLRYLYAQHRNDHGDVTAVRDAIATLPPEQREAAFLRHVVGLSPRRLAILAARGRRRRLAAV